MEEKEMIAENILLLITVCIALRSVHHIFRIIQLTRQRKTRWRIHLREWTTTPAPQFRGADMRPYDVLTRVTLVWDTALPSEIAIRHLPMVGTKWGDAIVESVEELS